jgi:hypothetical protein
LEKVLVSKSFSIPNVLNSFTTLINSFIHSSKSPKVEKNRNELNEKNVCFRCHKNLVWTSEGVVVIVIVIKTGWIE